MSILMDQIGTVLHGHRVKSGYSQAQIAHTIGVSQPTLARIERGYTRMGLLSVVLYAYVLGPEATKDLALIISQSRRFMNPSTNPACSKSS